MVKLYSKASCVQCTATARFFKKNGVQYQEIKMDEDETAYEYITRELGATQAPVVELADGSWWSGFNPDKIKEGIANGTIQTNLG